MEAPLSKLFEKFQKHNLSSKNRLVRSATFECLYKNHSFDQLVTLYEKLSAAEVGVLITGLFAVNHNGLAGHMYDIKDPQVVEQLPKLAQACHKHHTKIIMQINHVGRQTFPQILKQGPPKSASAVYDSLFNVTPDPMTLEEINQTLNDYIEAGVKAYHAGYDGVQIHGAHGYLVSQFLSPHLNLRQDGYGGDTESRSRLAREIALGIKARTSSEFSVGIKINSHDFYPDGIDEKEFLAIIKLFNGLYDFVEISAGTIESNKHFTEYYSFEDFSYYHDSAKKAKEVYQGIVILVGNNRSFSMCESVLENQEADMLSFSRGLIAEPDLLVRWKKGDTSNSKCTRCNTCVSKIYTDTPLQCWVYSRPDFYPYAQEIKNNAYDVK